jgi:hypothetical protein
MSTSPAPASQVGQSPLAWSALAIALICGGILRLAWIEDMEWKKDEQWSYRMSQEVGRTRPWPWVGMRTSLGFSNPGPSVWIFVAIGQIAHSPTSMAGAVVLLNLIALVGFAGAVRACLPSSEREPWLWGIALEAVSPFAVRISRKIWPPSTLTPLLLLLWISHQHRRARWGAFTWGLSAALIGQVHLSGWFVALGLLLGTIIVDCRRAGPRPRYWHWWLLGTVLGLASAVPWARTLPGATFDLFAELTPINIAQRVQSYLYGLVITASSAYPFAALGLGEEDADFGRQPTIDGVPSHLTDLLRLFIVLTIVVRLIVRLSGGIALGLRWARLLIGRDAGGPRQRNASATSQRSPARREHTSTAFYLWSTIALPGLIFVISTNVYFYHYFYVLCPFLFVLIAACLLPWRGALLGLVLAQALLSVAFLNYVHQRGGVARGEYGLTYARQANR